MTVIMRTCRCGRDFDPNGSRKTCGHDDCVYSSQIFPKRKPVFVFGSNLAGRHGAGAAKSAYLHHGALMDIGLGSMGDSWAIPTKDRNIKTLSLKEIEIYVNTFLTYAFKTPERMFYVTRIGCGLAGYKNENIAPMFDGAPSNVRFDEEWEYWLPNIGNKNFITAREWRQYERDIW